MIDKHLPNYLRHLRSRRRFTKKGIAEKLHEKYPFWAHSTIRRYISRFEGSMRGLNWEVKTQPFGTLFCLYVDLLEPEDRERDKIVAKLNCGDFELKPDSAYLQHIGRTYINKLEEKLTLARSAMLSYKENDVT